MVAWSTPWLGQHGPRLVGAGGVVVGVARPPRGLVAETSGMRATAFSQLSKLTRSGWRSQTSSGSRQTGTDPMPPEPQVGLALLEGERHPGAAGVEDAS